MTKIIIIISLFISSLVLPQGQCGQVSSKLLEVCRIEKVTVLFATFKPEIPFSSKWGLDRAEAALKNCK